MSLLGTARGLVMSSHPGPTAVVTTLSGLLGRAARLDPHRQRAVVAAVLTGQLSIGWSNDLIDVERDRRSGRTDKPIAAGTVPIGVVRAAAASALALTGVLSGRLGRRAGLAHGVLVGSGWAYNLGLKRTLASFVPYAVAFGTLPQVPTLSASLPRTAPLSQSAAGALLGVGAHLLNALPDLDDDARTGVHGLPHRMSPAALRLSAAACLVAAGWSAAYEFAAPSRVKAALTLASLALGVGVAFGQGKVPFYSAAGCALIDAAALTAAGRAAHDHDT